MHAFAQSAQEAFDRALSEEKKGNKSQAIQYYTQAIQLDPHCPRSYNNRGTLKRKLGDNTGENQDFNTAIKMNPRFGHPYYNRGILKTLLGNENEALADFDKAKQLYLNEGDKEGYNNAIKAKKWASDWFTSQGK